MARTNTIWT